MTLYWFRTVPEKVKVRLTVNRRGNIELEPLQRVPNPEGPGVIGSIEYTDIEFAIRKLGRQTVTKLLETQEPVITEVDRDIFLPEE